MEAMSDIDKNASVVIKLMDSGTCDMVVNQELDTKNFGKKEY